MADAGGASSLSAVHVAGGGAHVSGGGGGSAPASGRAARYAPPHDAADGGRDAAADARARARVHAAPRDGRAARHAAVQPNAADPARSVPKSVLPTLGTVGWRALENCYLFFILTWLK